MVGKEPSGHPTTCWEGTGVGVLSAREESATQPPGLPVPAPIPLRMGGGERTFHAEWAVLAMLATSSCAHAPGRGGAVAGPWAVHRVAADGTYFATRWRIRAAWRALSCAKINLLRGIRVRGAGRWRPRVAALEQRSPTRGSASSAIRPALGWGCRLHDVGRIDSWASCRRHPVGFGRDIAALGGGSSDGGWSACGGRARERHAEIAEAEGLRPGSAA